MSDDHFDAALDLLRRLPPSDISQNLEYLTTLVPALTEDLLSSVDQPLTSKRCAKTGKDYLICDYNRDADSYRSPWSNEYDPPLEDGTKPSDKLREMEQDFNVAFATYLKAYFEGGYSSVYLWDLDDDDGFAGVVLLKNQLSSKSAGVWDSIHVFEATNKGRQYHYKLTSTVILHLSLTNGSIGEFGLGGSMTKQVEKSLDVEGKQGHRNNLAKMIEDLEFKMRSDWEGVNFANTQKVVSGLRSVQPLTQTSRENEIRKEAFGLLRNR